MTINELIAELIRVRDEDLEGDGNNKAFAAIFFKGKKGRNLSSELSEINGVCQNGPGIQIMADCHGWRNANG